MNDTKGLVERLSKYVFERKRMQGFDPETIHALHIGSEERECELTVSDLERALTALKAQGWQPISTAPRDERLIVLRIGNERPFVGYHVFDEDETGKRSAWMDADESFLEYKPTHWMPLPQPPKEPNNKEEA